MDNKIKFSLLQNQIEEAVLSYFQDRVKPQYEYDFGNLDVDFTLDGNGRVSCWVEGIVVPKEKEQPDD